jgi:MoaA/NifB/PqqE/SkfB family radical SAM enzyme
MKPDPELDEGYRANMQLNTLEFDLQRLYLRSMPRYITIVLGNGCNLSCRHCYQLKNGDHLFQNPQIALELRREFSGLYPYLSTIRFQGGEVLALDGFRELIDDVDACVSRPIISISTNGMLLDEEWAQRMVRMPFQSVTFSIDGGTAGTFERLRRGARFDVVVGNLRRLQEIKKELHSSLPNLDVFYVVMRSNYREIPQFLELMKRLEIDKVAFQTILLDDRNLGREPGLSEEALDSPEDVERLRDILQGISVHESRNFRRIFWSGFRSLFERHGLDHSFLREEDRSLYPGQDECSQSESPPEAASISREIQATSDSVVLCPNPWSLILIAENGDVSICFMAECIGNIFEAPLAEIWNSPKAIAKRSEMIAGRYLASGCSRLWCGWREGKSSATADLETLRQKLALFKTVVQRMRMHTEDPNSSQTSGHVNAVRRLLQARNDRIRELEAVVADLWEKNAHLHYAGQEHINKLESKNAQLRHMVYSSPVVRIFSILALGVRRLFRFGTERAVSPKSKI